MRAAELERAQAMLKPASEASKTDEAGAADYESIKVRSPVSGHILRVYQESETVLSAGATILEVGDPHDDLEVGAGLLSSDAVKVSAGDRVIIDKWGGDTSLSGAVERIEPIGFTKISALGVEEQRVNTIIGFDGRNDDLSAGWRKTTGQVSIRCGLHSRRAAHSCSIFRLALDFASARYWRR